MSIIPIVIIKNLFIIKIYHMGFLKDITTLKTSVLGLIVCHYLRNMMWISMSHTSTLIIQRDTGV